MSTSVPPPPPPAPPSPTDQFFDGIRRAGMVRSDERWIGGVAGGLSLRAGVDPLVGRAVFVVAAFLGGLGLVAYGVAWALLPEQRDGRIHLQELLRGHFDVAVLGAFLVTVAGFSSSGAVAPWWGFWGGEGWAGVFWFGVLVLVAVVVVSAVRSSREGTGYPAAAPQNPYGPDGSAAPGGTGTPSPASSTPAASAATTSGETMSTASLPPATAYGDRPPATAYGAGYGGHAGGGYGGGGYGGPVRPPLPPVPPAPAKPVVRGAGATATGVVVGLGLVTLAALMVAQRYAGWDGPILLTAGATTVVLAGLGIVIAGTRGRSSGGLGAVAVLTTIALLPIAALEPTPWTTSGVVSGVGELDQAPATVTEAERGFAIGAGEARIDLTRLPLAAGDDLVEVPVSVGAGDVTVTMPREGAYTATVQVFAGDVRWLGDRVRSGVGNRHVELESPAVRDGEAPRMHLVITVGAGEVTVVEAGR